MFFRMLLMVFIFVSGIEAKMFQSVSKEAGEFIQSGKAKYYCPNCGMNLVKFYKTNHIHNKHQYCSLHCLFEATEGEIPDDAKVVDVKSLKFTNAKDAYYVIGSDKKGTMTKNSKYVFKNLSDAEEFVKKNGGKIVNFTEAYAIAAKDFPKDMKMINIKKKKKIYKMGKKLYEKKCDPVNSFDTFQTIAELKASLKDKCKKVNSDKELQAIALYLWDLKREKQDVQDAATINPPKNAKCPVCGMFVYKYPKWAAVIETSDKKYYFDGTKDMFKFYIPRKDDISKENIYVTDYFSGKKIKAAKAYYVMGSNVYGPMGNELIPFASELDANAFKKDHFGIKILDFIQIVNDNDVMEELEEL